MTGRNLLQRFAGKTNLDVMRTLKRTLDPNHVLNPGKIFDRT
jgi:FAD/FMN-containing dehydrogenase